MFDFTDLNDLKHPYEKPSTSFSENVNVYKHLLSKIDEDPVLLTMIKKKEITSKEIEELLKNIYPSKKLRDDNYSKLDVLLSSYATEVLEDVQKWKENKNVFLIPPSSLVHQYPKWFGVFEEYKQKIFKQAIMPSVPPKMILMAAAKKFGLEASDVGLDKRKRKTYSQLKSAGVKWLLKTYFPEISDLALAHARSSVFDSVQSFYRLLNKSFEMEKLAEELQNYYEEKFWIRPQQIKKKRTSGASIKQILKKRRYEAEITRTSQSLSEIPISEAFQEPDQIPLLAPEVNNMIIEVEATGTCQPLSATTVNEILQESDEIPGLAYSEVDNTIVAAETTGKMQEFDKYPRKLFELEKPHKMNSADLEQQLVEKNVKLETLIKEKDKLKVELSNREAAEKDKIDRLKQQIEAQTVCITELCTSNKEMSFWLERTQCELEITKAQLHKQKNLQLQYKNFLTKMQELSYQNVQGVEDELEEVVNIAHHQLTEVGMKLKREIKKNAQLTNLLRNERNSHCCQLSRINIALKLSQYELRDCQEQLKSAQIMISARNQEIETLKKPLKEKNKQVERTKSHEQVVNNLKDKIVELELKNDQMRTQLETTKSNLNDTLRNLQKSESIVLKLEQTLQVKDEQLQKMNTLEELLQKLQHSVAKLESENNCLRRSLNK